MKSGGPSIAVLLGKSPMKGDDYGKPDSKEEEGSESDSEASEEEYRSYLETAFPDEDWTKERIDALHEFVMACTEMMKK